MTLIKKIILTVYCLVVILLCTIIVPWQGSYGLQERHTKVFMGYAPVFGEPSFTYSEDIKSHIMLRLGFSDFNRVNLFKFVTSTYQIDLSRLFVEIFVLTVITALIIYLLPRQKEQSK